jgi:glycosyltransferase involved in cell wall biosynthesis
MISVKPFFSIVIPTYNHADLLNQALQSVLDQQYGDWEVLVVDNNSNDHTNEVVLSFNDNRIKLLKIYNRGVIAKSRNMGINAAKGEWVAFLDSDDYWYPTRLAIVAEKIQCTDVYDVMSTNEVIVNQQAGTRRIRKYGPYSDFFYETLLTKGNMLSTSATIVRKKFLDKHDILFSERKDFIAVEDYDMWLQCAQAEAKFNFIDSVEGEYLIHNNNISKNKLMNRVNLIALLKAHLDISNKHKRKLANKINSRIFFNTALNDLNSGDFLSAVRMIAQAILKSPSNFSYFIFNKIFGKL